jgi:AP-3 complex subunit sigma
MAILSIMVINNHGQPRLLKFYHEVVRCISNARTRCSHSRFLLSSHRPLYCAALCQPHNQREQVVREAFSLVSKRSDSICNFLEGSEQWGSAVKLIYRHYATLYFVVAVDSSESELGILDLIQVFVEALDKCFANVCELDLIFHTDRIHFILDEIVMGGMVLETSLKEILKAVNGSNKYQRDTQSAAEQKTTVIGKKMQS